MAFIDKNNLHKVSPSTEEKVEDFMDSWLREANEECAKIINQTVIDKLFELGINSMK